MGKLYDMHCHLDFADNAKDIAAEADGRIVAIDATVVPSSYVSATERLEQFPDISVGLGLHPWWVAEGRVGEADVDRFCRLAGNASIISEIGLDFHGRRAQTRTHQMEVLARLLQAIDDAGGDKLIFFHAVKSYDALFDLIERFGTAERNQCAFHWFSGSRDDFGRALAMGMHFSVGMRMMATDAGALFAASIPDDKVLVETDSPAREGMPWSADAWVQETENATRSLAELRGVSFAAMLETVAANSRRLLQGRGALATNQQQL